MGSESCDIKVHLASRYQPNLIDIIVGITAELIDSERAQTPRHDVDPVYPDIIAAQTTRRQTISKKSTTLLSQPWKDAPWNHSLMDRKTRKEVVYNCCKHRDPHRRRQIR
jgi:hypothetical protein